MAKIKENKDGWKLDEIKISFKEGYDFKEKPEEKVDRYEGLIRFSNKEQESFQFKVRADMADDYINLIAEDIVRCAESLGSKLIDSLGLKDRS